MVLDVDDQAQEIDLLKAGFVHGELILSRVNAREDIDPALLVVALVALPRSTLCSFTSAPGTTAPVSSVISPEIVAVSVWAIATAAKHNTMSANRQAECMKRANVIVANPPFSGMPAKLEKFANEDKQFHRIVDASRGLMTVESRSHPGVEPRGRDYGWFGWLPKYAYRTFLPWGSS